MREVDDQAIKDMFACLEEENRSEARRLRWLAYAAVAGIGALTVAAVAVFGHLPPPHTGAPVAYGRTPPDGGSNSPRWINYGAYNRQVRTEEAEAPTRTCPRP